MDREILTQAIGWASSAILLATLVRQIVKQQTETGGAGVSHWLFIGQTLASIGFLAYSILVKNWVFIVTNSLILLTSLVGYVLQRRREHAPLARERTR